MDIVLSAMVAKETNIEIQSHLTSLLVHFA